MRISDWSSDVCSSDLAALLFPGQPLRRQAVRALHIGEGPGFDGHILQKQPGLHRGIKGVGMECELGIGRGIATARQDRLDIEQRLYVETRPIAGQKTGRASCRARVGQYVELTVDAVTVKKK